MYRVAFVSLLIASSALAIVYPDGYPLPSQCGKVKRGSPATAVVAVESVCYGTPSGAPVDRRDSLLIVNLNDGAADVYAILESNPAPTRYVQLSELLIERIGRIENGKYMVKLTTDVETYQVTEVRKSSGEVLEISGQVRGNLRFKAVDFEPVYIPE